MEEGETEERPAIMRIKEAAALPEVHTLVVSCPKDLVMFRDAAKSSGYADRLVVKDLIELVAEALDLKSPSGPDPETLPSASAV